MITNEFKSLNILSPKIVGKLSWKLINAVSRYMTLRMIFFFTVLEGFTALTLVTLL